MNVKAYIESGVLELYVMEALSPAESRTALALAQQYPAIQAEIEHIQEALNEYILLHAREPRPELKKQILDKIQDAATTVSPLANTNIKWIALLIFALIGWLLWLFFLYKWTRAEQELEKIVLEKEDLETRNWGASERLDIVENPTTKTVRLKGRPNEEVIVYWNQARRKTLLSIKNLAPPTPGTQYQLWAIVNNKPQDAGLITFGSSNLQEMNVVVAAEVFAITLEKEGGSAAPTSKPSIVGTI